MLIVVGKHTRASERPSPWAGFGVVCMQPLRLARGAWGARMAKAGVMLGATRAWRFPTRSIGARLATAASKGSPPSTAERRGGEGDDAGGRAEIAARIAALNARGVRQVAPPRSVIEEAQERGVSKSMAKKLWKKELRERKKREKKERWRAMRAAERERKAREARGLPEGEREERRAEARRRRQERRRRRAEGRERARRALQSEHELAFDFRYWHRMREAERNSLAQQLSFLYGANKHSRSGCFRLHFTSFDSASRSILSRYLPLDSWHLVTTEEGYKEHFSGSPKRVVYLSSDSPNELERVSSEEVYVVGCFVDRNKAKNVTHLSAQEDGVPTARLPLHRFSQLRGSPVLTVNQVVSLLIAFRETGSWHSAIERALPSRKLRKAPSP